MFDSTSQTGQKQVSKALPSTVHRRKHQLTYLAFQAKETELALAESHARGKLTKSQTQAKYGW